MGLYSVSYARGHRGLPVVGGGAVVLADGSGRIRALRSASSVRIDVATRPSVTAKKAETASRKKPASVATVDGRWPVVRLTYDELRIESALERGTDGERFVTGLIAEIDSADHLVVFNHGHPEPLDVGDPSVGA
ncbi:hypothetical protein [Streptomyces sp. NPDC001774]